MKNRSVEKITNLWNRQECVPLFPTFQYWFITYWMVCFVESEQTVAWVRITSSVKSSIVNEKERIAVQIKTSIWWFTGSKNLLRLHKWTKWYTDTKCRHNIEQDTQSSFPLIYFHFHLIFWKEWGHEEVELGTISKNRKRFVSFQPSTFVCLYHPFSPFLSILLHSLTSFRCFPLASWFVTLSAFQSNEGSIQVVLPCLCSGLDGYFINSWTLLLHLCFFLVPSTNLLVSSLTSCSWVARFLSFSLAIKYQTWTLLLRVLDSVDLEEWMRLWECYFSIYFCLFRVTLASGYSEYFPSFDTMEGWMFLL